MSITLMAAAWRLNLPATRKLALLALADWANDEGGSLYPSVSAVAERCSVSRRTAQRLLHDLVATGWLEVIGNEHGGRPGMTRHYQLAAQRIYAEGSPTGAKLAPLRVTTTTRRVTNQAETGVTPVTRSTIDPSLTVNKEKKRAPALGCPEGVDAGTWADWLLLRKAKRAPVTTTVLAGIRREAALAGITLEEALQICCLRGWVGLKADWLASVPVGVSAGRESVAGRAARLAREGDERERRQMQTAGSWPEPNRLAAEYFS